jgi:hypothetical protein
MGRNGADGFLNGFFEGFTRQKELSANRTLLK